MAEIKEQWVKGTIIQKIAVILCMTLIITIIIILSLLLIFFSSIF